MDIYIAHFSYWRNYPRVQEIIYSYINNLAEVDRFTLVIDENKLDRTRVSPTKWNVISGSSTMTVGMMFNRVKDIMRRPGGKRYVVASLISMIGGGGKCKCELDLASCLTKLNVPDKLVRWMVKTAEECGFSDNDHLAAHGSEERFKDWFEIPATLPSIIDRRTGGHCCDNYD